MMTAIPPLITSTVVDAFADRERAFIGGRLLLYDAEDHPITIRVDTAPIPIPPRSVVPTGLVQGANMAFRRDVLERIGGFDDALGPGTPFCNDDVDAVARASAAASPAATCRSLWSITITGVEVPPISPRSGAAMITGGEPTTPSASSISPPVGTLPAIGGKAWASKKFGATMRELGGALDYTLRRLTRRLG